MSTHHPGHTHRTTLVREFVHSFYEHQDDTVQAIMADGWPEPMAREGLAMHRRTWDVDGLLHALERELAGFGGLRALHTFANPGDGFEMNARLFAPKKMIHVWPALPGAGLTPVLMGWLMGAQQIVRPSSRGQYFAELVHRRSKEILGTRDDEFELLFGTPDERWKQAEVLIASGSDETIESLRSFLGEPGHRGRPTLIGYGHRVSFGVLVDDGSRSVLEQAERFATDAVMWHQTGCFSARAIIFCGTYERSIAFCERLGEAIALCEARLGATNLDDARLAARAQARGVAELMGAIYGNGVGWAQPRNTPWYGDTISTHTLGVHTIQDIAEIGQIIKVPSHQLQGCALYAPRHARRAWAEALARQGVTRICSPGMLQSPPPSWFHDGQPNMLDMVRISQCELDLG